MNIEPVRPDINFGYDPLDNLYDVIAELREAGHRVVPVNYIDGIAWLLLRYDDVDAAFSDEENLPGAPAYRRHSEPAQGRTVQAMQGEEHRINRALVSAAFQPGKVRQHVATLLAPAANRLIDAFPASGSVDLVKAFTHAYPFTVISEMVGIPPEDRETFMDLILLLFRYPWEPERALQARAEVTAYLQVILDRHRESPCDDLISMLAEAEVEGRRLTDEEIFSFIRLLYPAGAETTYLAMGAMMGEVLADRALYEHLRDTPADRNAAVEEALRKHAPTALLPRYTEHDVTIGGVQIPADSWLLYGIGPSGHDPDVFKDPESFRLDRGANRHITFGKGQHFCLGSHLAREELRIALSLLLDRLPGLRLAEGTNPRPTGGGLRGVHSLQVEYDAVLPARDYTATRQSVSG